VADLARIGKLARRTRLARAAGSVSGADLSGSAAGPGRQHSSRVIALGSPARAVEGTFMTRIGWHAAIAGSTDRAAAILADHSTAARQTRRCVPHLCAFRPATRAVDGTSPARLARKRTRCPARAPTAYAVQADRIGTARGAIGLLGVRGRARGSTVCTGGGADQAGARRDHTSAAVEALGRADSSRSRHGDGGPTSIQISPWPRAPPIAVGGAVTWYRGVGQLSEAASQEGSE
jgi:hypothetical protein